MLAHDEQCNRGRGEDEAREGKWGGSSKPAFSLVRGGAGVRESGRERER
jgi:hypothetical protein